MATWKHVLQALIVRISALLAVGLRGVGQLMWRAIGHCETVLRALLHATAVFVGAALGFLLRSVAQVVYWLGTRLAARLAYVAWLPAALRASLDRLAARRFDRDRQRLALWWQDWRHEAQRAIATPFRRAGIALTGRASKRQLQRIALVGILILTVVCGPLSLLGALGVLPIFGQSGPGQPHHVDPSTGTHSIIHLPPAPKAPQSKPLAARPPMAHGFPPHMQPGLLPLDPAKDAQFNGSDGRLEVDVPAGAVSADDVKAAPGNQIALRLTEIAPPSGSNAGGSGIVSFGTYLAELVDGKGRLLSHGLRKNATIKLHYGPDEQAFNLDRAFIVFNGAHPKSVTGLGPSATQGVTHDRTNHLLLAHLPADPALAGNASTDASASVKTGGAALTLPGGFAKAQSSQKAAQTNANKWGFSFNTDAPVAKYGGPDPLNVDLTSGSLTDGIQLDVPPGPAQAMPNITLSYNSGTASEQHSPQAAAGWMGEGWNATLGQISWAERDLSVDCKTCGSTWRNVWYLNDPFGTSTELIPPVTNVSTNYDDTPYYYCATGNASAVACPIQFQTARESYARVYAYRGPINTIGGSGQYRACWRVYLPNGVMEEFGCTPDSVQYYPIFKNGIPGGTNNADFLYITNLYLDLITNPQGDQVHITYQSDTETVTDPATGAQKTYPRDTVLSTIEWDSPTCVNRSQACTGASWAPHYRVQFNASHTPSRLTNSPSFCNTASNVRCDDPVNLTGSGQLGAPLVESTFVLNDVAVQTNLAGTWNTVRDYQLSYAQNGPATITDPVTGLQESAAGYLNLTQLQEVGDDGTSAYPAQTFSYTYVTQYYEDGTLTPYSTTFCGPSWNTGGNGGTCDLWSQSYAGNSWYLTSISNGQGLQETISWQNARNNTHGANAGLASPASPLACNGHEGMGYPCNEADDQQWSRATVGERDDAVVQVTQNGQGGQPTSTTVTSRYVYTYTLATLTANECTDCLYGMYWGSQNDGDYLDYYNPRFMGFAQTSVSKPDGSLETHTFYSTEGWGVWNTNNVNCTSNLPPKTSCHNSPWWDLGNAGHGLETSASYYDTNGTTLLKQTSNTYTAVCPPGGVGASQSGNWNNESVDELGVSNPMAVCDVQRTQSVTKTFDGSGSYTSDTEAYTYDNSSTGYGRPTQTTSTVNGGGSSPTTVVDKTTYTAITSLVVPTANKSNTSQEASWSGGLYIIDLPTTTNTQDSQQVQSACTQTTYDGSGNPIEADQFTGCGSQNPVALKTTITYDNAGNPVATTDSDANGGVSGHTGCNDGVSGDNNTYTSCSRFNDNLTQARIVSTGNASNQSSSTTYTNTAAGGYGLWPTQITDPNNQQTAIAYDALGRVTSTTLPGETAGLSTTSKVYANWCSGTSAQSPCVEEDTTQRLNSTTTVTARDFYDGQGRLVETRTPAPSGQDVVQYTLYNADGEVSASSVAYFVAAYTGAAGSAAYSIPDSTQAVISATYDGVGRTLQVTDALSNVTTAAYSVVCNAPGTGDAGCYEQTLMTNADTHRHGTLTDGFGRATYDQSYSGNSGSTYVLYATTTTTYDTSGRMMNVLHPDGVTQTAFTYDTAGRMTSMSDPDRGSESYTYDPNSNLIQATDARGASGTTYLGYDGQNRTTWRNTTNSSSGAYVTYSYDSTANGNDGVGRLTGETFSGGPNRSLSGSDSYVYDGRGNVTSTTLTVGTTAYPVSATYNDADMLLTQTYPTGEVVTTGYDSASSWLTGLTRQSGGTTTLFSNVTYSGPGGAQGQVTGAQLGGGTYQFSATHDLMGRPTDLKMQRVSDGARLFEQAPSYDAIGNVTGATTTMPAGTDVQQFCYDEQDRLTWAGSAGTPPCTGTAITPGTLTSAQYSQSFTYDVLDRLTNGPLGSYTYGDSAHKHAATSIGSSYTASYDASGNMTCRAPTNSTTCSGSSPNGAQLAYDNEGQLFSWQNAPSSPTSTASYLYDGEGNRVEQQVTSGASTTTTVYVGGLEEIATSGSTTTTTTYYYAGNQRIALAVNGSLSYLVGDLLGSANVSLDGSGNVTAQQLFTPYGMSRYSSGVMPTDYGFTGQHSDVPTTGLDYYNARYYDPTAGQFASADTVLDGLNRYAYVSDNPETVTDPSGNCPECVLAVPDVVELVGVAIVGVAVIQTIRYNSAHPGSLPDVLQEFGSNVAQDAEGVWNWATGLFGGGSSAAATAASNSDAMTWADAGTLAGAVATHSNIPTTRVHRHSSREGIRSANVPAHAGGTTPTPLPGHPGGSIPVSVPDLGGIGAAQVVLPLYDTTSTTTALRASLRAAGRQQPQKGWAAHHIVAQGETYASADAARKILAAFGIDINDAANGVWLDPAIHNPLHTNAYYDAVLALLRQAQARSGVTANDIRDVLRYIGKQIEGGKFP